MQVGPLGFYSRREQTTLSSHSSSDTIRYTRSLQDSQCADITGSVFDTICTAFEISGRCPSGQISKYTVKAHVRYRMRTSNSFSFVDAAYRNLFPSLQLHCEGPMWLTEVPLVHPFMKTHKPSLAWTTFKKTVKGSRQQCFESHWSHMMHEVYFSRGQRDECRQSFVDQIDQSRGPRVIFC